MTDKERTVAKKFEKYLYENGYSEAFLVEIIKLAFDYGNVKTVQSYADSKGKSYQGIVQSHKEKINYGKGKSTRTIQQALLYFVGRWR